MSQPAKAQEPSMEEILASIRRIIADDDTAKAGARRRLRRPAGGRGASAASRSSAAACSAAAAPGSAASPGRAQPGRHDAMMARPDAPAEAAAPAEDVLELTEQMAAPAEEDPPSFQTIDGQSDVVFTDPPAQPEPPPPRMVEEPRRRLRRSPARKSAR